MDYSTLMDVCRHADEVAKPKTLFRAAAVRHRPTGQVYEGSWHPEANDRAYAAGHSVGSLEEGYVDHAGVFVNRWDAERHMPTKTNFYALTGQSAVCSKLVALVKRRTDDDGKDDFDEYD